MKETNFKYKKGMKCKLEIELELTDVDMSDEEIPYKMSVQNTDIRMLDNVNFWLTEKELENLLNKSIK